MMCTVAEGAAGTGAEPPGRLLTVMGDAGALWSGCDEFMYELCMNFSLFARSFRSAATGARRLYATAAAITPPITPATTAMTMPAMTPSDRPLPPLPLPVPPALVLLWVFAVSLTNCCCGAGVGDTPGLGGGVRAACPAQVFPVNPGWQMQRSPSSSHRPPLWQYIMAHSSWPAFSAAMSSAISSAVSSSSTADSAVTSDSHCAPMNPSGHSQ
mmetsp:Transcript_14700/g.44397  ORF Transcript_14700/g.44397 Transcript_14700/m.44397 type:complete len:213 (-) Transcript_14700:726-1364(-)